MAFGVLRVKVVMIGRIIDLTTKCHGSKGASLKGLGPKGCVKYEVHSYEEFPRSGPINYSVHYFILLVL